MGTLIWDCVLAGGLTARLNTYVPDFFFFWFLVINPHEKFTHALYRKSLVSWLLTSARVGLGSLPDLLHSVLSSSFMFP